MGKIIDVQQIYDSLKKELKDKASKMSSMSIASLKIGQDYAMEVYMSSQEKLAKELGINFVLVDFLKDTSADKIIKKINELNEDNGISGIIVNKPFPEGILEDTIFSAISPKKDIEGANPLNLGVLFYKDSIFIPPTVLSVLLVIEYLDIDLYGKEVTIVGFSSLIGMPLSIILGRRFATLRITHIGTYDKDRLLTHVKNADVLISAVGKPYIIKGEWIKEKAVVIDVGIGKKDGKVCGDVEFGEAKDRASFITPVPGGIGLLTTLCLFGNLIKAAQEHKQI